jgi:hypothetical protein
MSSRVLTIAAFVVSTVALPRAQGLLLKPGVQHARVAASTSAPAVVAGKAVTLFADVTPNPSIHIYAEGARDFTPVSLVLTPHAAVSAGKVVYPKADAASAPGATESVPAYTGTFRIALPITVGRTARSGETLTVAGAVTYQACDDRLCYPVTSAPVVWTVSVK